jgi:hypothetical protein
MQTFLPYPDIIKSVSCLDNKRLGKQRVEAYQILRALSGYKSRWINHPAVKMWQGYEQCLEYYMNTCIDIWIQRGFYNTMLFCTYNQWYEDNVIYPIWLGNKDFHDSHKSNLLRKDPKWYSQYNWNVPDNLPYIWPVK